MNDVWQLNVSACYSGDPCGWEQLFVNVEDLVYISSAGHPSGRYHHSAVFRTDPSTGAPLMTVFAGYSPLCTTYCNDLWDFDFDACKSANSSGCWTARSSSEFTLRDEETGEGAWPAGLWKHVASGADEHMFVFGGYRPWSDSTNSSGFLKDIIHFDFAQNVVTLLAPLVYQGLNSSRLRRVGHGGVYDVHRSSFFTLCGYHLVATSASAVDPTSGQFFRDVWQYSKDTNTWTRRHPVNTALSDFPSTRYGVAVFHYEEVVGVFGGRNSSNTPLADVWQFNTSNNRWSEYNASFSDSSALPAARSFHAVANLDDGRWVVYGGLTSTSALLDTWLFDMYACVGECSGHGSCYMGWCVCDDDHYGDDCSRTRCESSSCVYDYVLHQLNCTHCSSRGTCDGAGTCYCSGNATGRYCNLTLCPSDCTLKSTALLANGTWVVPAEHMVYGVFNLDGAAWAAVGSNSSYYANGACDTSTGTCTCNGDYTGSDCSFKLGCTDPLATNYDPDASQNSGCTYASATVMPPTITFNMTLAVDYDSFLENANRTALLEILANAITLDVSRLAYVSISAGSTLLEVQILEDPSRTLPTSADELAAYQATAGCALDYASNLTVLFSTSSELSALNATLTSNGFPLSSDTSLLTVALPSGTSTRGWLRKYKLMRITSSTVVESTPASSTNYLWVFALVWAAVIILQ